MNREREVEDVLSERATQVGAATKRFVEAISDPRGILAHLRERYERSQRRATDAANSEAIVVEGYEVPDEDP